MIMIKQIITVHYTGSQKVQENERYTKLLVLCQIEHGKPAITSVNN